MRIDDVVHKPGAPWTPTVHAVLRHLEARGFTAAPRALGFDEQGREMLTYMPGEAIGDREPRPAWASADSTLEQVGRWPRRVHDLTADFEPPEGARFFTGSTMQPGYVVGHQDAAPYDPASVALLPIADRLSAAATDVEALPDGFWDH